jgi:hypothetical protein
MCQLSMVPVILLDLPLHLFMVSAQTIVPFLKLHAG